jgi:RNA polymerase sigma-70 factor (family 1)
LHIVPPDEKTDNTTLTDTAAYAEDNRALFRLVAEGDEAAFRRVYDRFWPQVYGTSLRLTRDPEQARDLSQDIFVRLWENKEKLGEAREPGAYIYILSRNLVMDFLRKKTFDPANIDWLLAYFSKDGTDPQARLEYKELEAGLRKAVESLPDRTKEVFRLSRVEGLTHEQIAARMGISVVSSKTYIVRALRDIRQYMTDHSSDAVILVAVALLAK